MFRCVILPEKGNLISKNFETREEVDEWVLSMMNETEIKMFRVKDKDTGEIVEDETGRRDKKEENYG